ncbi:putative Insecticidal toxin protein [Xenorhabdus sp. KK7.4]|nr:putative Insecticidal toxin protein [Xenorhabdus sp. KK7.4]
MLAYDGLGRLASVTQAGSTQTYGYDASGRLALQRRDKADTRELYYQGASRVAEIQRESGAVTRLVQAGSTPAASVTADGVHLLGTDGPGSVLLSRHNDRTSRFRYTPYGQQAVADSDPALPGYNGERQDPAGGGYHLGNGYRTYNPVLMRFTAPDSLSPFGAGGLNPYAYCLGDPINRTDPSGHISVGSILGIALGLFGMAAELAAAIPTGGASLTLSGAILAGVGFLGAATGLASAVTEDSNPQASAVLGWISMGCGAASLGSLALGKMVRGMRQASLSHMLTEETAEIAERPERIAVSGPPSPRIEHVQLLGRVAQEDLSEERQSAVYVSTSAYFALAVRMGDVQEIISPVGSNFHTLQLTLPAADAGFFSALDGLGFDTTQEVSRINNLVDVGGSIGAVDIGIDTIYHLYTPIINVNSRNGTEFINAFRYDLQARSQIYSARDIQEIQRAWAANGFSYTFDNLLWRNLRYNYPNIFYGELQIAKIQGIDHRILDIHQIYQRYFFS